MSRLVARLLSDADRLDQATKDAARTLEAVWHERLASTCTELAELSQAVEESEALLTEGDVAAAEDVLLRCVTIANHLSTRLNELKRQAHQC